MKTRRNRKTRRRRGGTSLNNAQIKAENIKKAVELAIVSTSEPINAELHLERSELNLVHSIMEKEEDEAIRDYVTVYGEVFRTMLFYECPTLALKHFINNFNRSDIEMLLESKLITQSELDQLKNLETSLEEKINIYRVVESKLYATDSMNIKFVLYYNPETGVEDKQLYSKENDGPPIKVKTAANNANTRDPLEVNLDADSPVNVTIPTAKRSYFGRAKNAITRRFKGIGMPNMSGFAQMFKVFKKADVAKIEQIIKSETKNITRPVLVDGVNIPSQEEIRKLIHGDILIAAIDQYGINYSLIQDYNKMFTAEVNDFVNKNKRFIPNQTPTNNKTSAVSELLSKSISHGSSKLKIHITVYEETRRHQIIHSLF